MSDLWMILVLLGVSIVLAVVIFNWWQEKKYRRDVEFRFSHTRSDVLDTASTGARKDPARAALTASDAVPEDMEGWMSEPRVRGSGAKVEPSFSAKAAITSSAPAPSPSVTPITEALSTASDRMAGAEATHGAHAAVLERAAPQTAPNQPAPAANPIEQTVAIDAEAPEAHGAHNVLPPAVHISMDWVGLIDAPLGVMLVELEDMQAEVRTFPQHASLWAQSATTGEWQDVLAMDADAMQTQVPASQVACSIQLADRGGPIDNESLKRFQKSMETLSRALGLTVVWQGGYAPAQQAQAIDAFCIEVDKAVEFHVLATQGMFHATKLRGLAEANGMQLSSEGRYEVFNNEGQLVFSVRNYEGKPFSADMLKSAVMTGVTFQLDIPTTPQSVQVFDQMVEVARSMASSLSASLIDVNRKPIGDAQLDKIRQQLHQITDTMTAQCIFPGSSHACRLFS